MSELYRDDVTGDLHGSETEMVGLGIVAYGALWSRFDTHEETLREEPDAVAEKLHDRVDQWLEDHKKQLEVQEGEIR